MTYQKIDFKLSDMTAHYNFDATPDGKTILRFTQTSVDKGGLPVESVQKGALRELFLQEVRIANKGLGVAAAAGGEPPAGLPEVAIAGRSNVGKSSLINTLTGRRALARTSATPGRTRQINFFLLNEAFSLVDLPGYGFAVGPEVERRAWGPLVEGYLRSRRTLRGVLLVVDVRRG